MDYINLHFMVIVMTLTRRSLGKEQGRTVEPRCLNSPILSYFSFVTFSSPFCPFSKRTKKAERKGKNRLNENGLFSFQSTFQLFVFPKLAPHIIYKYKRMYWAVTQKIYGRYGWRHAMFWSLMSPVTALQFWCSQQPNFYKTAGLANNSACSL